MAIEQDILVAVATLETNEFRLGNVMDDVYPEFTFNDFANIGYVMDLWTFPLFLSPSLFVSHIFSQEFPFTKLSGVCWTSAKRRVPRGTSIFFVVSGVQWR